MTARIPSLASLLTLASLALLLGCPTPTDDDDSAPPARVWECQLEADSFPDFAHEIGCEADFAQLASAPLDASLPGARSAKTVLDRLDGDALYFQNSERYPIHWNFASEHLSGAGLPIVPQLAEFNGVEYYSPDRRFILGAVTFYEGPQVWAYEIAPYDTADASMITKAYRSIANSAFFGQDLYFHPSSEAVANVAQSLPSDVKLITTDELFAGIDYQPLNLATSMGLLTFYSEEEMETALPWFRETVVLEAVPNDIAVVAGIVTEQFQTPLSHINVLSQNRGTPNMGLRLAFSNETLRALEGEWVELTVGPFEWSIEQVTAEEAEAWWEEHRPEPIDTTPMDLSVTDFRDDDLIVDLDAHDGDLRAAIQAMVPAFGGKATHFGSMATIEGLSHPDAFAIPVHWYDQHMTDNGLWEVAEAMLADPDFQSDPVERDAQLTALQNEIRNAPIDPDFLAAVIDKLNAEYPGTRVRFRSSTNAEDVSGFNGAGLYTSKSGDPNDPDYPVDEAIKKVWSSVWRYRAYEEREYYGIDHRNIGMALLVHRSFPDEDANGVAVTGNIFDTSGLEPAFYVNVQLGEESVVLPDPGVTTDQYIHYYTLPGQPVTYLAHSSLVDDGDTVLDLEQTHALGEAMQSIHLHFAPAYGTTPGVFYAMDLEFKFDSTAGNGPELYVKQARPYPGRGQ
jgi:pyruvate, water dikinase